MKRTLSVTEQERLPIADLGEPAAERLLRLWERQRFHGLRPKREGAALRFSGMCGVIGLGEVQIEILPKLLCRSGDRATAMTILVGMLRQAGHHLHLYRQPGAVMDHHRILDVMIGVFLDALEAQMALGMLRRYQEQQAVLSSPRGKLLISRYVREPHPLRFPVRFAPLDVDNPINRALKFVLCMLLRRSGDGVVSGRLRRALSELEGVADSKFIDIEALQVGREQARWQEVVRWLRWFLRDQGPNLMAGASPVCSLLFPMNLLFQDFMHACLKRLAKRQGLTLVKGGGKYLARSEAGTLNRMQPDHLLMKDKQVVALYDSKWKLATKGPSNADIYQLYAYGRLFQSPTVNLLYPSDQDQPSSTYQFQDDSGHLTLHRINLTQLIQGQDHFESYLEQTLLADAYLRAAPELSVRPTS